MVADWEVMKRTDRGQGKLPPAKRVRFTESVEDAASEFAKDVEEIGPLSKDRKSVV